MTFAEYTEKSKKREKKQMALDKSDKAAKFLEEKLAKCNTKAVSMLCPTEMLEELNPNSTKAGACVSTLAECFVGLDGAVNKTLMLAYRGLKDKRCPASEKYCDQEGIWFESAIASVTAGLRCPPETEAKENIITASIMPTESAAPIDAVCTLHPIVKTRKYTPTNSAVYFDVASCTYPPFGGGIELR